MQMPQGFSRSAKTPQRACRERDRIACMMRKLARERGDGVIHRWKIFHMFPRPGGCAAVKTHPERRIEAS
jgi:hypothetical protein